MEAVALKLPITLRERSDAPDEIRVQATWEEYLELAGQVPTTLTIMKGKLFR